MILNGSEILLECLIEQGVDTIFGYPGGAVLNIYDALYKYRNKINHYLTSHEQGASHAADGYSRASGKVGVCLATSGPGATNLVTGIANAYMDSIPMVAITGNVASNLLGKDSFQEVDILGITMPITKHNFIVNDVKDLADIIRRAFYIAKEGRPGPVLVDIPKDITANTCDFVNKPLREILPKTNCITQKCITTALKAISESKKPFIIAGGGVIASEASDELYEFVKKIDSPIALTTMALDAYPNTDPLYTGMIGMHGSKTSNLGVTECDLLIAIGCRFADRVTGKTSKFAPNAKIIHIDVDPAEINKNIESYSSIIGDIKEVLKILNSKLDNLSHTDWTKQILDMLQRYPVTYKDDDTLKPQYILECINKIQNKIVCTDVGQHQMWACQYIDYTEPRTWLTSGGLGTMGFGLGASIGAKVARPDKTVFNIAGDGCFRMNCIELATAVEYNIPIIECILNNHSLGMVRQWQSFFYDKRFSHTTLGKNTDFVALAKAYNADAFNVTKKEEVEEVLKKAIELNRPVVINFEIGNDESVFPMVSPGAAIDDLITE